MNEMTIGEVARRAHINTSTIRYYERIGLLPKSNRIHGHRRFDSTILQWLALIDFAQQAGFKLGEIGILFHGFEADTPPAERWQTLARQKLPEIDQLIARAQSMKNLLENGLRCGCLHLEDCIIVAGSGCTGEPTNACAETASTCN